MTRTQKMFCTIGMIVAGHNAVLITRGVLQTLDEKLKGKVDKRNSQK